MRRERWGVLLSDGRDGRPLYAGDARVPVLGGCGVVDRANAARHDAPMER
jgi:hypothetical protein